MIDIAIMNYAIGEVVFVKADEKYIEENYRNSIEAYLSEYLMYDLDEISWMSSDSLKCVMFNGGPSAGLRLTNKDYWDEL